MAVPLFLKAMTTPDIQEGVQRVLVPLASPHCATRMHKSKVHISQDQKVKGRHLWV